MNKIMELRNKRNALWEQTKTFLEEHRGAGRHGSCGVGIWETLLRDGVLWVKWYE